MLPDALSHLYNFDAPGMVHTPGEYLQHDPHVDTRDDWNPSDVLSTPLYVGLEAMAWMDDGGDTAAEQCGGSLSATGPQSKGPADGQPRPSLVGQDGGH